MSPDAMTDALAAVFERAPGLAKAVRLENDTSPLAIVAKAREVLGRMSERERIAVLDAHPRIGADPGSLSVLSRREQGDDADAATLRELAALNDAYERKFGFRFVAFVAGRPKRAIIPVLRARLANSRDIELTNGIEQFLAISLDRLERAR